ncbi:MAG TPA: glycerol kinase GlpK [Gemmatimonadaceae bacterium]|nr:glycerol kinase GlpK [Gemmatimonadaceae bacterium]
MKHVLAIDQGTTGSTCLVVSADGRVVGRGYQEITQYFPEPGWVEHDPDEILARTWQAARAAIAQAGVTPDAIGITNQRETVVLWERDTGRPVHRAIVWQDRRTAARCAELAPAAPDITARTGLVVDAYFSATKLEWLLRDEMLRRRAERGELAAGTIDSWLVWHLTGGAVHATDHTNASRTLLYDIGERAWSAPLLERFGVPAALLPEVRRSSGGFGATRRELFGTEIPIAGVAGDQQAALFGQGCWSAGQAKNTYGTGAFLLLNTGARRPEPGGGLLTTVACDAGGGPAYALEAAIFIAGAAVQWLRDGLGVIDRAADTEEIARRTSSNDGVYFVPALTGLGAPNWEPEARGTIVGLTRGTTKAHLVRAALEAMAYGTYDVMRVMRERHEAAGDGGGTAGAGAFERLRVDGGATENGWLMQFQADVLGAPVERPDVIETTALGAAGLAGIATGVWPSAEAFIEARRFTRFAPGAGARDAQVGLDGWHRAVHAALAWARYRP